MPRKYIPIGFLPPSILSSNKLRLLPDATLYHFGILTSAMHMAWTNVVTGRLKSDYQYSIKLVYNNYPWPQNPTDKHRTAIEEAAQAVLDTRKKYPSATLADLYDPLAMPVDLLKAHARLDRAVDRTYRDKPFDADRDRVEHLFALYEQLTTPLAPSALVKKSKKSLVSKKIRFQCAII